MQPEKVDISDIKFDCRHFKGGIPCKPNKLRNKACSTCDEYSPIQTRVLIIKLGALGDVIRTTPLVTRFKNDYPGVHITWITLSPAILPKSQIDEIYPFDFQSTYIIRHQEYDIALNLDKEYEACALLDDVKAKKKYGFILENHHLAAATPSAEHKVITGLFDQHSQANTKNYMEEIFEICEMDFKDEEYLLDVDPAFDKKWEQIQELANGKTVVGLNTGCGQRWPTRMWAKENWVNLIQKLQADGYYPVVLGGPEEDELNLYYAKHTGCYYPGLHSLKEFIAIANHCDVIVSAVSMMMHIAMGLKKHLVLFNNIFNKHEFHMFGRGVIIEPKAGCECYYGNSCKRETHCMESMYVDDVLQAIKDQQTA